MAILLEDGTALLLEDGTPILLEDGDSGVSPTYPDDWELQNQGPRTIRQLYHWAWRNFSGIATYLGSTLKQYLNDLQAYLVNLIFERTRWMGAWQAGEYVAKDQVLDGSWLMIANKTTNDRAAPQPQGLPFYIYPADNTTTQSVTASQVIFGQRYTGQSGTLRVTGYRIYTVIGNTYRVFLIEDPLSASPIVTEIFFFTANNAGWQRLSARGEFLPAGKTFDLIVFVAEPDPTPTTFTGDWDYQTPQNPAAPAAGAIVHSRSQPATMNISTTDANLGDRYAELATLDVGDTIDDGTVRWSIQSTTDLTTYFTFGVSPATNSTIGTKTFTFETVTATPISYEQDLDYWTGNALVQGLFGADIPYDQIVPDESQYGIDIEGQNYDFSPDWDIQSTLTGSGGGASAQQLTVGEIVWVASQASAFNVTFGTASGPTWQEIGRREIPDGDGYRVDSFVEAKRTDAFGYGYGRYFGMAWRDGTPADVDYDTIYSHATDPGLDKQITIDGNDVVFEVRTAPGQNWDFKIISYFNEIGDLL